MNKGLTVGQWRVAQASSAMVLQILAVKVAISLSGTQVALITVKENKADGTQTW